MSKTGKYDEKSITHFSSDLAKVRSAPNMYVGPTDGDGLFTIMREVLDNAVDEARAGRNDLVHLFLRSGEYTVHDAGVGIPVRPHPGAKISTLTHVLTALQSSGKMKGDAYQASIGRHGVGIKGSNALSESFEVWTYRKDAGGWHYTKFKQGVERIGVKKTKPPRLPSGKRAQKGTVIKWTPDTTFFGKYKLNVSRIPVWAELTAYMNPGLKIVLDNEGKIKQWYSKKGIIELLEKKTAELKATPYSKKSLSYHSKHLDIALSFTDAEGDNMEFFTNTVRNEDRGFHADSFFKALFDSLKPFQKKHQYTVGDLKEGLVGILNFKIEVPNFSSQTKDKLVDERGKKPCYEECLKAFGEYWDKNKSLAREVCERAAELRKRTADFLKDKKLSRNVKKAQKNLLAKLAPVVGKTPLEERELMVVEGDSAGGTSRLARHKEFQAIFSLKGKPLNCIDTDMSRINGNKEIAGILAAIGIDPGLKNPLSKLSYGKIIFLADPDVDGPLVGSTKVWLADGSTPTLESLYSKLSKEDLWVWAFNNNREMVRAKVTSIVRSLVTELVQIRFDDGTVLDSTLNHGYPMDTSGLKVVEDVEECTYYKKAQDIVPGDKIVGFRMERPTIRQGVTEPFGEDLPLEGVYYPRTVISTVDLSLEHGTYVYCLVVPETGNFLIADRGYHAIGSSNCHINALLMGLFWKFAPSLYRDGKIYMVDSPEFIAQHKGRTYFGNSVEQVRERAGNAKLEVRHLKGWGEVNAEPMREIVFTKGRRRLYRIEPPVDRKGGKTFEAMLGKDPTYRKQMLGLLPMKPVKEKKEKVKKDKEKKGE